MNLEERALLVKLTVNQWSAIKTDREVSREVTESKHARSTAGKFQKNLFGRDALKKINGLAQSARIAHYNLTLPWNDDGARIITTESYQNYTKVMRNYRQEMQEAVDEFLDNYDDYVKKAKEDLGKMFKKDDYPDVSTIKGKFRLDVEPSPIPVSKDFRAKVSNAETKAIIKDIERRTNERLENAMKDVWARIAKATQKMAEKLENYKPAEYANEAEGIFRDSLVENIRELAEVLPSLNLTNNSELIRIQEQMVKSLCKFDAKELREDEQVRRKVAKKAQAIYDKVSQYMA